MPSVETMDAAVNKSERETLKSIWRLTSRPGGDGAARTGDLATSLRVAPGTMTATIKRLADQGLVSHTPYRGVELTEDGRKLAMTVVRRHRVVERFLADMLGYSWSEADRLAPTFEHQLPHEVAERLFVALDRPATCPHGFPIPGSGSEGLPEMPPLYDLEAGDRATVALPGSTDPDVAIFLDGLGLRPGVEVEIREKHPFDGPLVVSVDGLDRTIGERVARQILVRDITRATEAQSTEGHGTEGHGTEAQSTEARPAQTAGQPKTARPGLQGQKEKSA